MMMNDADDLDSDFSGGAEKSERIWDIIWIDVNRIHWQIN